MKIELQKAMKLLTGRVAMNIYFWVLFITPMINIHASLSECLFAVLLYTQLMTLVYLNNLVLVPLLLAKKKYPLYFISIFSLLLIIACTYTYTLKQVQYYHPDIELHRFIFFVYGSLTTKRTLTAVLLEMWPYYINLLNLAFVFTLVWYVRDYFHQQRLTEELKKKQLETELRFLRAQINPHFLFNTLNNLYGLTIEKSNAAPDAVLKLSSILRYILYESNTEKAAFNKEKEIMLAYIDLELLRLRNKDDLQFSITADVPCDIPPLLWLPVLENVFKHGTRLVDVKPIIDFSFIITNGHLIISSKNRFKPNARDNRLETSSGIGLANLRQRLEIFCPGKYTIKTAQVDCFYTLMINVDLN